MLRLFRKLFDTLIFGNFFIAFAACCLFAETQILLGQPVCITPAMGGVFFSTWLAYGIHRAIALDTGYDSPGALRHSWIRHHKKLQRTFTFLAVAGLLITFFFISLKIMLALSVAGLVTLAYSFPLAGSRRLRELPGLKVIFVAAVWSLVTVVLPAIESEHSCKPAALTIFTVSRFFFVLAITIPFDIRDYATDRAHHIKTIPVLCGKKNALRLSCLFMLIFAVVVFGGYVSGWLSTGASASLLASAIFAVVLIWYSAVIESDYYYLGLLDGAMVIQGFLVLIFS